MDPKQHPNYDARDYAYLKAKGWSDAKIVARWTEEHSQGKPPVAWTNGYGQAKFQAVVG